jgi:hypothetical protein
LDKRIFRKPGKEFRGVPFWSLNDKLEGLELSRQIGLMDDGWFGGFFLHAREGLVTPYMSEEWLNMIEVCVREAEKRGMYAWLYDEDKWPSGFAGGVVPASSLDYRVKALAMMVSGVIIRSPELLKVFECDFADGKPVNLRVVEMGETPKTGKSYIHFYVWSAPIGSKWFDGFSYMDVLNPDAVRKFIESTHEKYYQRFRKWFGNTIPGIFTDEPNYLSGHESLNYPAVPWTAKFPEFFKSRCGYDITDHLPSLFFDVGDYNKVRYDFWRTLTELFVESYSKQIYEWCDRHGLKYTGHYLSEESLTSQIRVVGAVMPHYEYMHMPGIDHLRRDIDEVLTVKQVASVANQLGRERVLSETYGCSGQNLSFEDRKWIGDWEYVLGVNFLNHHLSLYSMRGRRKRDYPPNIFYQQPWWKFNSLIESYFARLSYALSRGVRIADVLILHPIGSGWAMFTPLDTSKVENLHRDFEKTFRTLLEKHWDFELGDEFIIAKYGKVDGPFFIVGRCRYKAVIIPPSLTLAESTVKLLENYVANGGLLIAIEPTPKMVDCKPSSRIEAVLNMAVKVKDVYEAVNILNEKVKRRVLIKCSKNDASNVWYHLRRDGSQQILFLANLSRTQEVNLEVGLLGSGKLEEYDPFTGDSKTVNQEARGEYVYSRVLLPPVGSKLLVLDETQKPETIKFKPFNVVEEVAVEKPWKISRVALNALTLDYCRLKIDDSWTAKIPTWKAQRIIERLGYGRRFTVRYEFTVDLNDLNREIWLVLESPDKFKIKVNGFEVSYKPEYGWWIDTSFKRIPIKGLIKNGLNMVELEGVKLFTKYMVSGTDAHELETEIESIYIVGEFAVENIENREFKIVEEKGSYMGGDLTRQGYPFYAGEISVECSFNLEREPQGRVFLVLGGLHATVVEIKVNDHIAGHVFLKPYEIEITDFVKPGQNKLEIKLTNTLRNLLGPHHHKAGELTAVGPYSFQDELNWIDGYNFVPYGLDEVKIQLRT